MTKSEFLEVAFKYSPNLLHLLYDFWKFFKGACGEVMMFYPTGKTVARPEDTLIALGEAGKLKMLEGLAQKP